MSLNIKDERTHELVRELARVTGLSQTAAVRDAVERRLADLAETADRERAARSGRVDDIVRAFQADLTDADRARIRRVDDWLYDEHGLPR